MKDAMTSETVFEKRIAEGEKSKWMKCVEGDVLFPCRGAAVRNRRDLRMPHQ